MLLVAPVREAHRRHPGPQDATLQGIEKLKLPRSVVPAVTHVDYSARLQTVDAARHGRYYQLIKAFEARTGCPMLINTSFNVRGEPIVCTPEDAHRCFMATDIDVLVLERCVLRKEEQPGADRARAERERAGYLSQFQLD
jgi:carbamoyltransferase